MSFNVRLVSILILNRSISGQIRTFLDKILSLLKKKPKKLFLFPSTVSKVGVLDTYNEKIKKFFEIFCGIDRTRQNGHPRHGRLIARPTSKASRK